MSTFSSINWSQLSDQTLASHIGEFVRQHRLEQNKTQQELSHDAGISRSTLSQLEGGESVTLSTLIQVLRVLDQLQVMAAFEVVTAVSPLELAKAERKKRKRARPIVSHKAAKKSRKA